MKIQYIGKTVRRFESKHEITYSQLDKPNSLDMYEVNVFSLQNIELWKNKSESHNSINCINDFRSICKMIENSKKSVNIIVFPQNYTMSYYQSYDKRYLRSIELKDMINELTKRILAQIIPVPLAPSYDLIYENSITQLGNCNFNSSFCFIGVDSNTQSITKCKGSEKITTLRKGNMLFTTLDLSSTNIKFDDFLKGIGLDNEKTEIPEWLAELNYFDDSSQKTLITENEAKIVELDKQIDVSKEKIKENLKYKSILITNGSELVKVVFEMLEEMLDYSLANFVDENIEDFLIKKTDVTFIGEIKGVTSNVKSEHISQLDTHYHTYTDKLDEKKIIENVKAILIINPFRTKPLSEREEVHEKQINLAKRNESLIITTEIFLKLFELYVNGSINSESIMNIFKTKTGLLDVSDFTSTSNVTVDNSAYTM